MKIQFLFYGFFLLGLIKCHSQSSTTVVEETKLKQDEIIQTYVFECAKNMDYHFMMNEYQECLDEGLKKDSTIAYLWQQKAMPYYKIRKYDVGKPFLDNAVKYDKKRWLSYRGFMKCIFSKDYEGAIEDFERAIALYGNGYEMDHTFAFYIGLSYLQLNEFEKAELVFKNDIASQITQRGEAHFIDWFYYGMSLYEQGRWEEAITCFDESLAVYTNFSESQFYKAFAKARLGHSMEEIEMLFAEAKANRSKGYTINEDNAIYEMYPYQLRRNTD